MSNSISIHFVHAAPTPHNNYLLDALAGQPEIFLSRHYIYFPSTVPNRPWKQLTGGNNQLGAIRFGYNRLFDWRLLKLAISDKRSVFFVVGWEVPSIVFLLFVLGFRRRPLIMWDDGPSDESVALITSCWRPRQIIKRQLIGLINKTPGTYFITGYCKKPGVLKLGILPSKLVKLPFFVQSGSFVSALRDKHQCNSDSTLIVAGGRLIKSKGFDILISALPLLNPMVTRPYKLVLVGSGEQKDNLTDLAKQFGLTSFIDFVGWAESDLWANYIQSCDIFVAPARFDHFPTTVIAAMQAGISVVATDGVGSAVEFIESGRNGIIVPSESPESLASALGQLINDPTLREVLGSAAKVTMSEWPVERGARLVVDAARKALIQCAD
jgi:glycosyltransferase involved in cell wall biosynthesis